MHVDRIFISGYRRDARFTRCCVASIRRWYPHIPITLIKDEIVGGYDTSDLETHFDVDIFATSVRRFGWGMAKLEPLFLPTQERCLILDSDIVFTGRVLDAIEEGEEDFVVVEENHPLQEIRRNYFDPDAIKTLYPSFRFPGYVFNTGQIIARTGMFKREEFAPFVAFSEPRRPLQPKVFFCGEQGFLNFLVLSKVQEGSFRVKRARRFMRWAGGMATGDVDTRQLQDTSPYDFLVHWAGEKTRLFSTTPMSHLLFHFEEAYQRRAGR